MASRIKVTESEILDELRAAIGIQERKPGFHSISEMAAQLKCSKDAVRRRVQAWQSEGRIESMRVSELRPDGHSQHVTVYRLKRK